MAGWLIAQAPVTMRRGAMGTPWSVTVYAADTLLARRAILRAFDRIDSLEQILSDYRADSELNGLSGRPPRRWYRCSADLWQVLYFARRLAGRSRGAFDPTVGPLTKIWRRAFRQGEFPDAGRIARARTRVQYRSLRLRRGNRVWFGRDSMQLDLGGVGKGYALDMAGEVLLEHGFIAFLIDGGGDLLLGAPPPGRDSWRVSTPLGPLDTAHVSIATSGSEFRYLDHHGRRYSHLIDPRTGYGISDPRSVTVIAATGLVADGLASVASILGEEALARRRRRLPRGTIRWSRDQGPG